MRVLYSIFLLLFVSSCAFGPLGISKRALKQLEKGKTAKSQQLVQKALEKDSLLPAALYAKARLLISYESYEFYDSAHHFILRAQAIYDTLEVKSKNKHQKSGLDSVRFQALKLTIDSLAFERATKVNTEAGYNEFLRKYTDARQRSLAKTKRNILAFASAKSQNTYQSYKEFMEKYPNAVQVAEAKRRYEKLYFDKSTADGRVTSYIRFLEQHPSTPYRKEAEQKIFEVMTSEHSLGGYLLFLRNYPKSHLRKKAINYAYHVAKENNEPFAGTLISDSLRRAKALELHGLLPILEEGKFGFMDSTGQVIIKLRYNTIADHYLCKATYDDFLQVNDRLEGRNGAVIAQADYEQVEDLGYGLLRVKNDKWGLIHKSGEVIIDCEYEEIQLLNGNLLIMRKGDIWRIQTVSGRLLMRDQFDEVYQFGKFFFFEKNGLVEVKNAKELLRAVDGTALKFEYIFSDYELLPDGNLWLQSNYGEVVVNAAMQEVIPYDKQKIIPLTHGFLIKQPASNQIVDENYQAVISGINKPIYNQSWLAGWLDTTAVALKTPGSKPIKIEADSLSMLGNHLLMAFKSDTVTAYFSNDTVRLSSGKKKLGLIGQSDKAEYLVVSDGEERKVYDQNGRELLTTKASQLGTLGKEYIVFTDRGKKGLFSSRTGEQLLKPAYEAIGNYADGNVSLLKDQKFGLFNEAEDVFIDTRYDKNIVSYNDSVFIVSNKGKLSLLSKNNELLHDSGFDEIIHWNDTVAFVKAAGSWQTLSLINGLSEWSFQSYNTYEYGPGEKLAIILSDNKYGVLNQKGTVVIAPTFNDVVMLGTGSAPIIFTEKHIKEAEFYVVIYYDITGNILRKQAFEADAYYKVYCEQ